jgi:SAM-dependent methyltransferase
VESRAQGYDATYRDFDSPLMRTVRKETYGEDIGQHSWVIAAELRDDIARLGLSRSSRFLDLGCGPCGPLTFIANAVGCQSTGADLSGSALVVGRARAATLGVESLIAVHEADLNEPLPFATSGFDAVMALDVVLHVQDREQLFREVARTLVSGGRFLLTDAGVVTGSISSQEVQARSINGYTQFVAPGFNERALAASGLRLLETEDRTASVLKNATGRLTAIAVHRAELETVMGVGEFERQQHYLETVVEISRRGAVSRVMYLAESRAG